MLTAGEGSEVSGSILPASGSALRCSEVAFAFAFVFSFASASTAARAAAFWARYWIVASDREWTVSQ